MSMKHLAQTIHIGVVLLLLIHVSSAFPQTRVPAWNMRGTGPLPWQGIACLDLRDDGSIVVGTIAPPGDPNVMVIDAKGKLQNQFVVGQRWIGQVVFGGGGRPYAICTTPEGRANDVPTIYACGDTVSAIRSGLGESAYPQTIIHYGDHSNHSGTFVLPYADGALALYRNSVSWLKNGEVKSKVSFPFSDEHVAVSMAVHQSGIAVVGCASPASGQRKRENLFLLGADKKKPIWSRPAVSQVGEAKVPEKGVYGRPPLPSGKRDELPQEDRLVFAPLSVAVDGGKNLTRIATADYRGWQRWIRSSATGRDQNYGTRFMPARPTVTVYNETGAVVRRFDAKAFSKSMWVDLAFMPNSKWLLAYPHRWASRGLAGQTFLPADDKADTLWLLDIETGKVHPQHFPDAVADVAISETGVIAVTCWDERLYLLSMQSIKSGALPKGIELGGPGLVAASNDGLRFVVASPNGSVRVFDPKGKQLWRLDLEKVVKKAEKRWVDNAKAQPITKGLWQMPGGRVESDLGGQRLIEAPEGLILIEGHAGLSFESEWAGIKAAGFDPMQVKFVLATHEHGDHGPGAYLWRIVTGAKFICSDEMAYTLQHHIPLCSGYGFHPPVPTDIRISADKKLNLAGLPIEAIRLPGHTYGSMGWMFTREKKKYVAIGDLIMPDGLLGYSGSINFSGTNVLASLRKLDAMKVDFILAGHGPTVGPKRYLTAGIEVGSKVGWGKIRPESPDPRYRLNQENVLVAGWNMNTTSADFGDFDGDKLPDVAVVTKKGAGSSVKIFINRKGKFSGTADHEFPLPKLSGPIRIRVRHLNEDSIPDLFIGGRTCALLLSQGQFPNYKKRPLSFGEGNQARMLDLDGDQKDEILVNARFGTFQTVIKQTDGKWGLKHAAPKMDGPYPDFWAGDVNGDSRKDLVSSYGKVYLRNEKGLLPQEPSQSLPLASKDSWSFMAVGDFNADGKPDITLSSYAQESARTAIYYNSGNRARSFNDQPDSVLELNKHPERSAQSKPLLRDTLATGDWNGDGIDDLIVGRGQDKQVLILLGSKEGLSLDRSTSFKLDYRLYYESGLYVADFNGDGKQDVAALGYTNTGLVLAAYIYLQK